jgi:hypothetical protein
MTRPYAGWVKLLICQISRMYLHVLYCACFGRALGFVGAGRIMSAAVRGPGVIVISLANGAAALRISRTVYEGLLANQKHHITLDII